jgi:hypothetical protein
MEIRHCQFCNSQIEFDCDWKHDACQDFTIFVLDELICKARKKLEILLLKRKELIINNQVPNQSHR